MNIFPKLVLLTAAKQAGKDTFARLASELYPGQVRSIALADWFKSLLAEVTGFDLEAFYDDRKEAPYQGGPRVLTSLLQAHVLISALLSIPEIRSFLVDCNHPDRAEKPFHILANHANRKFLSHRELMVWFGHTFFHECFGSDELHCQITQRAMIGLISRDPTCQYLILTDARTHYESKWFAEYWNRTGRGHATKVFVTTGKPTDGTAIENGTQEFPADWFDKTIHNSKTEFEIYKHAVQEALRL